MNDLYRGYLSPGLYDPAGVEVFGLALRFYKHSTPPASALSTPEGSHAYRKSITKKSSDPGGVARCFLTEYFAALRITVPASAACEPIAGICCRPFASPRN